MTLDVTPQLVTAMLGYYGEESEYEPPPGAFGGLLTELHEDLRFPVLRTTEDRPLMSPVKYALILQRDGAACRACWSPDSLEMDHIFPYSAFDWMDAEVADRSDNLHVLCRDCNLRKMNFLSVYRKRPGVVPECWECRNPAPAGEDAWAYEEWTQSQPELPYLVFCGRCGIGGRVPALSWVL